MTADCGALCFQSKLMNLFPDSSKLNCLGEGLENGNVLLENPGSVTGGEIHGCRKQGRQNDRAGHPCGNYDDAS